MIKLILLRCMAKPNIPRFIHSNLVRWMLLTGLFFLALLTLLRVVFYFIFTASSEKGFGPSFWMGFRYDARLVCVFLLIILIAGITVLFKPFNNKASKI